MNAYSTLAVALFVIAAIDAVVLRHGRLFWLFTFPFAAAIWMTVLAVQAYTDHPNVRQGIHMVGLVARAAKR